MRKIQAVIATIFVLGAQLAQAQSQSLKVVLDPAQTQVHWKLGAELHKVDGTFKLKSGEFIFNPSTGVAEGEILVDATTGESGNPARDKRMHEEVLESNRYPAIFFHPAQIKGTFKPGETTLQLQAQGSFNIHGADHALELPVKVETAGDTVTATAHFTRALCGVGNEEPKQASAAGKQAGGNRSDCQGHDQAGGEGPSGVTAGGVRCDGEGLSHLKNVLHVEGLDGIPGVDADDRGG